MLDTFFNINHMDEDTLIWKFSKEGNFTVKSAYTLASKPPPSHCNSLTWIWKTFCGPRQNFFLWRAFIKALPTAQKLSSILPNFCPNCKICNSLPEDIMHNLRDCPVIRNQRWLSFKQPLGSGWYHQKCSRSSPNQLLPLHQPWKHYLSTFDQWELRHIYREANRCEDILANHARTTLCSRSTFLEPPDFLLPLLASDLLQVGTIRNVSFKPP
ncbi:reverse transcriptase [Senna tora]|uniref:Reverse transcriptase n=1 Tax=Senna tora TaxID=362788 RepID=A0A834WJJ0_9FABA|nr:reverse transcriptase [Senna tora]